jgi:hypothetical protein
MLIFLIFEDRAGAASRVPAHSGQVGEGDGPLHEGADMRLHGVHVLGQHRLLELRDHPLVGQIDAIDLDLGRLLVEQVTQLLLGELADRLVGVEEAAAVKDAAEPAVHAVAGDRERPLIERLALVVDLGQVDVVDRAAALAARAHAAEDAKAPLLFRRSAGALDGDRAGAADRGDVEGERVGRADVRLPEPTKDDPQHRVGVGGGADGGASVGPHPLLVDDDRRRQALEQIDVRAGQRRHEALHEGAVGLVDQPLRIRGDRAEHQRALARAGDAGEHRQPALRDLDADIPEVVHARALHADKIVAVGDVRRRGLRIRHHLAHRVSFGLAALCRSGLRSAVGPALLLNPDHAARGIADGAVADAVWLLGRLLDDLAPLACSRAKVASRSAVARRMPL